MSRGKPLPVGPTARLAAGTEWTTLAGGPRTRHPAQSLPVSTLHTSRWQAGGLSGDADCHVPPSSDRFDVDFDLPDAFMPEFPLRSSSRTVPNSATSHAVRSCRSTTSMPCSKICSPRSS